MSSCTGTAKGNAVDRASGRGGNAVHYAELLRKTHRKGEL
jgi:hypothetical protein